MSCDGRTGSTTTRIGGAKRPGEKIEYMGSVVIPKRARTQALEVEDAQDDDTLDVGWEDPQPFQPQGLWVGFGGSVRSPVPFTVKPETVDHYTRQKNRLQSVQNVPDSLNLHTRKKNRLQSV